MFGSLKKYVVQNFEIMNEQFKKIDKRLDKIDEKLDEHTSILNKHTKILDEHTRILDEHSKKIDENAQKIQNISEAVILIENKVMTEFPALFEAFELHQEMHKDYDEKNSYLSLKVEDNSMRISVLEDQMKFIKNN